MLRQGKTIEGTASSHCSRAAWARRALAASLEPGSGVSAVARQAGIHPGQFYYGDGSCARGPQPPADFAAVRIVDEAVPSGKPAAGTIEVELANGSRVRITGPADVALVRVMMTVLAKAGLTRALPVSANS